MTYSQEQIIHAAKSAHEVNRAYCAALGDTSQPSWDDAPSWQRDSAVAGVEAIVLNPSMTAKQQHESWLETKSADGWKYGPVKDPVLREHPCFLSYSDLPCEQRYKDQIFGAVVRGVLRIG